MARAEGLADEVAAVGLGHVVDLDVVDAGLGELRGENVRRVLRATVDGTVEDNDGLVLGRVARPLVVLVDDPAQVLTPDGAVRGAQHGDVERGGLGQHVLDLRAVLAHDVAVVTASLVKPLLLEVDLVGVHVAVEGAEAAEGVGAEEDAGGGVEGHHDLGPVHHGGLNEGEGVRAHREGVALSCGDDAVGDVDALEELADHGLGERRGHQGALGIAREDLRHAGGMVGLHVVDDEVVEGATVEHSLDVLEVLADDGAVDRVDEDGLLVKQQVGVVGHAVVERVDVLEQGKALVAGADPPQVVVDLAGVCLAGKVLGLGLGRGGLGLGDAKRCKCGKGGCSACGCLHEVTAAGGGVHGASSLLLRNTLGRNEQTSQSNA